MAILSKAHKPDNFELHNSLKLSFTNIWGLRSNFVDCESFFWNILSWHSCSVWEKPGGLNWFWQFLCESLSSFNLKGFWYSYARSGSLCERRTSFCSGLISRKLQILYVFDWFYFTQCLTSFSSIDHILQLFTRFLILFHLT